jgi:hypothetical protein
MGAMAMLNYDVYEAFRSAGADEDKARRAAEALAQDHDRFANIEAKLDLHSWMIGAVVAMNVAILVRLFIPT